MKGSGKQKKEKEKEEEKHWGGDGLAERRIR